MIDISVVGLVVVGDEYKKKDKVGGEGFAAQLVQNGTWAAIMEFFNSQEINNN